MAIGAGKGGGRGRRKGVGPGGECVCLSCGYRMSHQAGVPCMQMSCPKCGGRMVRG